MRNPEIQKGFCKNTDETRKCVDYNPFVVIIFTTSCSRMNFCVDTKVEKHNNELEVFEAYYF